MKASLASFLLAALLAPTLLAQEAAAPSPAAEAPAAPPAAAEPVPPISGQPADLTPAKEEPVAVPERTMELLPSADSGPTQILPEPVLIPEAPEMTERPDGTAIVPPSGDGASRTIKKSKTEIAAGELAMKVRYRQVKTRAMGDPAVQSEWMTAQTARTDAEKRAGLRRYYKALFARMARIDKSLKKQIEEREQFSLKRLQQNRIETSEAGGLEDRQGGTKLDADDRDSRVQIGGGSL